MYLEKQHYQHPGLEWLRNFFFLFAVAQLVLLTAGEAGKAWLPLAPIWHWLLFTAGAMLWFLLSNSHLRLQISANGWDLQYFPLQWHKTHVDWRQIKTVNLVSPKELPVRASFGFPGNDSGHVYLLANPLSAILRIDLANGFQIFISTQKPEELLEFLRKEVFLSV